MDYDQLLERKKLVHHSSGIEGVKLNKRLFPFQRHCTEWALKRGRAALLEECGLGKSLQLLEWSRCVHEHTNGPVLVLSPLGVTGQTIREAEKFHVKAEVKRCQSQADVISGINITNYDRLKDFDPSEFAGVVLDESSILKNLTGKTRLALTEGFAQTPYKLCCTATPAPNDFMEFGQHAEFLGVMTSMQMLATFFINDTFDTGEWRLKGHAVDSFWEWLSTWAACVGKPSDIGFSDEGYDLPPLNVETRLVEVDQVEGRQDGELFRMATMSATTIHREMKHTCPHRVAALAQEINASTETWAVWCNTNQEADALKKAIPDAVEVRGDDSAEFKEQTALDFVEGKIRVLLSKPKIYGHGCNFQHCHNTAFVGLSYSFEALYQTLRRFWRFGQTKPVRALIFQAETEGAILDTIRTKMAAHDEMKIQMKKASAAMRDDNHKTFMKTDIHTVTGEDWTMHHGDCVRVAREKIEDDSVGFTVFSPPFPDLFVYSNDTQDMGNCKDMDAFMEQFEFLVDEIMRVTMPGRECAVHCVDLLSTKWKHGEIGLQDFAGVIVRAFRERGWTFHSRVTIWKSPVTEMQRTKAHGLLYKTLQSDSAKSRVGCPDYLLVFRKPGENPKPITHTPEDFPLDLWQEVASPVWMTVDQGKVLAGEVAREEDDERHICCLQLDVIDRALALWSAKGDLVYSPFGGVGSEGWGALRMGRSFVGSELKPAYFKQACTNLGNARSQLEFKLA